MYSDEGFSQRPLLQTPLRSFRRNEATTDPNPKPKRVVFDKSTSQSGISKSLGKAPKARPLDLMDDFEIVEGIPTFTWTDALDWTSFHVMTLSTDKTRLALVEKEQKICVYDLLDNFRLIADSRECFNGVNCVAFPRTKNNEIIVVHENSKISFLSVPVSSQEGEVHETMELLPQKLHVIEKNQILPQYNFLDKVFFLLACHTLESWVFVSDPDSPNEMNIISVLKQEYRKVKIIIDEEVRPRATFMSVRKRALMSVVESKANNKTKKTLIWKGIDFEEEVIQRRPIEIEGKGIGFSDCGKYFLAWSHQQRRQSVLGFYELKALEEDSPRPLSSTLLPENIMDVKAKFVDRNNIGFSNVDLRSHKNIPIVAFAVVHQNNVSLSFWDPGRNKILKQVDVTSSSMVWSTDSELQFCLSPNLKWIVLGGWAKGRFGLFSLVSELLVWDGAFIDEDLARWPYSAFEFDAFSTKLIINCSKTLYACAPPCLVEEYKIEMCGAKYELSADDGPLLAPLTWEHQRLLSKNLLKRSMLAQSGLRANDYIDSFDAALSKLSPSVALLISKISPPLLFVDSLDDFPVTTLRAFFRSDETSVAGLRNVYGEDVSDVFAQLQESRENPLVNVFLYPDSEAREDHVVIFALSDGLSAAFKESSNTWTQPIPFSSERCFQIKQSNDGHCVACLMPHLMRIIDLNRREQVRTIPHNIDLELTSARHITPRALVLTNFTRHLDFLDGGVDKARERQVVLAPDAHHQVQINETGGPKNLTHHFAFYGDRLVMSSLEMSEAERTPTGLCLLSVPRSCPRMVQTKRLNREEWNPHMKRMIDELFSNNQPHYTLEIDDKSGHLWIMGIVEERSKSTMMVVPLGPFSLDNCLPSVYMKDYPRSNITMPELESALDVFRENCFTMTFNGRSNFDIVLEKGDMNMAWKISDVASNNGMIVASRWKEEITSNQSDNRLALAIEEEDYAWVQTCLDTTTKSMPPSLISSTIKKCFWKLWNDFRPLAISLLEEDTLLTHVCDVEVYDKVLYAEHHLGARMGTLDSIDKWKQASRMGMSFSHWISLYKSHAIKIERSGSTTKTKATLKVFYIDDVCKVGLNGIIRFLLMQNAPSYIFKSSLIKWVIIFKWETIWRRRSSRNFVVYLSYVGAFIGYIICIGYFDESHENAKVTWSWMFSLLCVTCLIAAHMAYKEIVQLITCCRDGKELFGSRVHGLQSYLCSPWNVVDVMSYIMLIVVFCLHVVCLYNTTSFLPFLYTFTAVELLMMCTKIWYYVQPFKRTGALVLLVENIIRDCVPFISLTLGGLIGFGFAMYIVFQSVLYRMDFEDIETKAAIDHCFGNPLKSMLTLFYAMVGMFDPMFFLNCGSWSILIIAIFISYLSMQMIMMLNMLIALMSDTFDRVKSTEEEQLLLGRARFIDACEAQLTRKQIENIEKNVDKWLYVIFPKDEDSDDVKLWQGKVKKMERMVEKTVRDCQSSVICAIKKEVVNLKQEIRTLRNNNKSDKQALKEMMKECLTEFRGESGEQVTNT